jgi:hypothetical protein
MALAQACREAGSDCRFRCGPPTIPAHWHQCFPLERATFTDPLPPPTFDARVRTPSAQSFPRRRAVVTFDDRPTVAVSNPCSAPKIRAFAGAAVVEPGAIKVGDVSHNRCMRGDSLWLVPATSPRSPSRGRGERMNRQVSCAESGTTLDLTRLSADGRGSQLSDSLKGVRRLGLVQRSRGFRPSSQTASPIPYPAARIEPRGDDECARRVVELPAREPNRRPPLSTGIVSYWPPI